MTETQVFICGSKKDHKCDDNGPILYGLIDLTVTDDKEKAMKEGMSWGSSSCSVCGVTSMERSMWEGP